MNTTIAAFGNSDSNRIIKVNHAGEFGAVNIYRAQILFGKLLGRKYVSSLDELIEHERMHLATFGNLLAARGVRRCPVAFHVAPTARLQAGTVMTTFMGFVLVAFTTFCWAAGVPAGDAIQTTMGSLAAIAAAVVALLQARKES